MALQFSLFRCITLEFLLHPFSFWSITNQIVRIRSDIILNAYLFCVEMWNKQFPVWQFVGHNDVKIKYLWHGFVNRMRRTFGYMELFGNMQSFEVFFNDFSLLFRQYLCNYFAVYWFSIVQDFVWPHRKKSEGIRS